MTASTWASVSPDFTAVGGEQTLFLYAVALTILRCKNTQRAFAKAIADQKAGGTPPRTPSIFFNYKSMFSTEPKIYKILSYQEIAMDYFHYFNFLYSRGDNPYRDENLREK